ncbi:MAG: alpha/beta fold hydrolase [Pedococcus sp.]
MTAREAESVVVEGVRWHELAAGPVRSLWFSPPDGVAVTGSVLVFPGLGLPRYLLPLARTLAEGGLEVVVFDALAFRGRRRRVRPTIPGLSTAGEQWLTDLSRTMLTPHVPRVVLGHSTGAQVALEVVLALQDSGWVDSLVMGGPTFEPRQRRPHHLVPAALTAWRKDPPTELVVLKDLARVRSDVVRIVVSGLRHRPEERVPHLRVPLTTTAGEADSFAPAAWLEDLAARAGAGGRAHVLVGSHNNVFPHAATFASLMGSVVDSA